MILTQSNKEQYNYECDGKEIENKKDSDVSFIFHYTIGTTLYSVTCLPR